MAAATALLLMLLGVVRSALGDDSMHGPWNGDVDTVKLDRSNFTSFIQSNRVVMVEFYTPWCGHCRKFAPEYMAAATELKTDGIPIAKVNVDDEVNHPFVNEYSLSGFPMIYTFKRLYDTDPNQPLGVRELWKNGETTKDAVVEHMRALALEPEYHDSADAMKAFVDTNVHYSADKVGVIVLGVFQDKNSENYKAFREATFGRPYPKFCWVQDPAVAAASLGEAKAAELAASKQDAVFVVSKFTDDPEGPVYQLPRDALADIDGIVRWVDIRSNPLVWRYSDGLSSTITTGKLQKFLWAFVDSRSPYWPEWEKAMTTVALEQRGQMKFVLVSETGQALMQFFNIDPSTLPQGLIVDLHPEVGQRQFKFGEKDPKTKRWNTDVAKSVTPESLRQWLEQYRSGNVKRYLRSEPVPEAKPTFIGPLRQDEKPAAATQDSEVYKIVGDTFEETIASGKDVLVNFYGDFSWCEHCKIYAPEWELIAKTLKPVTSLIVADMNLPLNDIEDHKKRGMDIQGYPDVYLFRAGEHHLPPIRFDYSKYFNGERGLRAVLEFVKDHAAIPFGDKSGNRYGGKRREEL